MAKKKAAKLKGLLGPVRKTKTWVVIFMDGARDAFGRRIVMDDVKTMRYGELKVPTRAAVERICKHCRPREDYTIYLQRELPVIKLARWDVVSKISGEEAFKKEFDQITSNWVIKAIESEDDEGVVIGFFSTRLDSLCNKSIAKALGEHTASQIVIQRGGTRYWVASKKTSEFFVIDLVKPARAEN